jgi:hypothetical protein
MLRIDLDPLLLGVDGPDVAARGLTNRCTLVTGCLRLSETRVTMTGVMAAATTPPPAHSSGTTSAAAAADALAIRIVVTDMPPDFSRLISPYASETCEPGTMSSRPSGQRTHALYPPS